MSINRVELCGNLTRDPELKATQGGMSVLTFGIAVNDRKKNNQTGEWEDVPNFFDCTMFGNRAESVSKYIHKGMKVALAGKLHYSSWEKDGQKHSKVSVNVDDIEFMQQRGEQGGQHPSVQQPSAYQPAAQQGGYQHTAQPTGSVYDEDIPF